MQIRSLCGWYHFAGCGTSQGPNLPSIASISSFAQILWRITSSAVKVVWIDTYVLNIKAVGQTIQPQEGDRRTDTTKYNISLAWESVMIHTAHMTGVTGKLTCSRFKKLTNFWSSKLCKIGLIYLTAFSSMIGYVQPCFEPWTGRFSHNTHHISKYLKTAENTFWWLTYNYLLQWTSISICLDQKMP